MQATNSLSSPQPAATWRYGLVYRPASLGAVPAGFVGLEEASRDLAGQARHGIILYDRPLTDHEIRSYELLPLLDADAVERLSQAVAQSLGRYARGYVSMAEEDPDCFRGNVHEALTKSAGYRVHVGGLDTFCATVVDLLKQRLTEAEPA